MLANNEIRSLVVAIGTAISENFNIENARYHKVIIMTDADVDGAHIRTLLLTLFYRYFRPLIDTGYLYVSQPPLYRIQSGKDWRYAYAEAQKDEIVSEFQKNKLAKQVKKEPKKEENISEPELIEENEENSTKGIVIQRYKGLGEMNPSQLWETTMNPEARILNKITINDAAAADHLFDVLMGEEVEPRKAFIQTHALKVQNLDI
jgi:DNA gyrase subunit B